MKPAKTSQVFIKPYDDWNRRLRPLDTITFILLMGTIFYHPLWLALLTSIIAVTDAFASIGLIVLNARKKGNYLR
jgi:hypothetical protein